MSYNYATQKPHLMNEEGFKLILAIRSKANRLIRASGAVMSGRLIEAGDSWDSLAAMDYLVETGHLTEVQIAHRVPGQHRIFIAGPKMGEAP